MPPIPLDTAKVDLVNHGAGAGFGILVDGQPALPTVMLLPAGQVDRFNLIVSGAWTATVTRDEVYRWAPIMARSQQAITGNLNGHANGHTKPATRTRAARTTATTTTPKTAARRGPPTTARK
jgi:hypothetical protein